MLSEVGGTVQFLAEVLDQNGNVLAETAVAWSSSDASVATIGESGLARAVGEGEATITATAGSVSATAPITVVLDPDRAGLAALYRAASGSQWHQSTNWLTDSPLGQWFGVEVGSQGRVTGLDLSWNNLQGSIPPEFGRLEMLKVLNLGFNGLAVALPQATGPHRLTGVAADGRELFSLSFEMTEIADGDGQGGSSFVFAVPAEPSWGSDLVRITLSGPEGSVALDADSELAAAIIRDPGTGRIRGIFSDLVPGTTRADAVALSPEPGLEVLFSRGLPDAVEWVRR